MNPKELKKEIENLKKSVKDRIRVLQKEKSSRQIAIEIDVHHQEIKNALSGPSYSIEKYLDLAEKLKMK